VGAPPTKSWHLLCLSDETLGWETGIESSTKRKTKDLQRTESNVSPCKYMRIKERICMDLQVKHFE
jgi:hypothetical protein